MRKKKDMKTYTKQAVKWLLVIGVINGMLPFVLSLLGRDPVAELGVAWITEIVAVIIGYLIKSYSENKQKAKQKHSDFVAGMYGDVSSDEVDCSDSKQEE